MYKCSVTYSNDDTLYSTPWQAVNTTASITVATKPYKLPFDYPWLNNWSVYYIIVIN